MIQKSSFGWIKHPSEVPEKFSIICIRDHVEHTYTVPVVGEYADIYRAFAWSMLRRSHAVGHASRDFLATAVKHLINFIDSTGERARLAADLDAELLRRFAKWLQSEKSGLSYRTAAGVFRIFRPAFQQWLDQDWVAPNFTFPRNQFPELSSAPRTGPMKGYDEEELDRIARCVLKDIEEHDRYIYKPIYLGAPPPLEMVAVSQVDNGGHGNRWTCIEYRTWWWEEYCECKMLSVEEIMAMPRGRSMIWGGAYKADADDRSKDAAKDALAAFYQEIGAGPKYARKYIEEPRIHLTPWSKWEYLVWYWENHCQPGWVPASKMYHQHKRFVVALKEHFDGLTDFFRRMGVERRRPTMQYLCPYYVGLLLTSQLNPSTIQRLDMHCVVNGILEGEKKSLAWSKPRAARSGITIPASSALKLAPANLVSKILKATASVRGSQTCLFATNEARSDLGSLGPNKATFQKAIKEWFKRHGIKRITLDAGMASVHVASNFRPAVAKLGYENTGDILFVKGLLGHSRIETSAEYVGRIQKPKLIERLGIHIEAIFFDAKNGRKYRRNLENNEMSPMWEETALAHCRDILNSPLPGQRTGKACTVHQACLSCRNLVITHEDIMRHFAAKNYYAALLSAGKIGQEDFNLVMDERIYMFERQIFPKYSPDLIGKLAKNAIDNPPKEYRL